MNGPLTFIRKWRFRLPEEDVKGDRVCVEVKPGRWELWIKLFGRVWFCWEVS